MKFDNLYENTHQRNSAGAGRFRMICIFLVVAAVTALVIWKLIPSSASTPVPPENPARQEEPQTSPEKSVSEKTIADPGAEAEKTPVPAVEDSSKQPGQTASAPVAVPPGNGAGENAPNTPAVDVKGVAGPGDLPAEKDKPQIPAEVRNSASVSQQLQQLDTLYRKKDFTALSEAAQSLLENLTFGSEPYRKTLKYLSEANWQRFLNRDTTAGFGTLYQVAPGDYLGRIVRKNKTTVAAVTKANKLRRSGNIIIGQKLFLLPGAWTITISKEKRLLELKRNDKTFMGFDIGIGRKGKTPNADFVIVNRLKHPTYTTSDGRVYKYGEKENELGEYFLKLASAGQPDRPLLGYGIHGTPNENTVTRSVSNGCVRMRNADVEKLFYIVPTGTPVKIRD